MKLRSIASSFLALSLVALPAFGKGNSNNLNGNKSNTVKVDAAVAFDSASEQAIVKIVNQERADAGLGPVTVDPRLREAARGHSRDMGDLGFFDHTSPVQGKTRFTDRIKAQGLAKFGAAGENIAAGSFRAQDRAQSFMKMWMNSDGHRANILGEDYNYIGVGVYITADGQVYATQVFSSLGSTSASPSSPIALPEIEVAPTPAPRPQAAPQQYTPEDFIGEDEYTDEEEEVYVPNTPSQEESIAAKKAKIKGILDQRSGQYTVTENEFKRNATQKGKPSDPELAAKKAKILSILEERSSDTTSQGGTTIIVVPAQPTYQQPYYPAYPRTYYTPKRNGCN